MDRIRELRNLKGVSQARLAVTAGMDPATLNRIEQGKGNPNLRTLEKLADALGVGVVDLLEPEAGKADAPPSSPEPEKVSEEERRFVVRGWTLIFEDLAARYEEVEEKLRAAKVEDFPEIVADIDVLASYNFRLLSREAEEVKSAPGVVKATEKIRSTQSRIGRLLNQKFGPLSADHAAQLDRFGAANAAASLTSGASTEKAEDERREAN